MNRPIFKDLESSSRENHKPLKAFADWNSGFNEFHLNIYGHFPPEAVKANVGVLEFSYIFTIIWSCVPGKFENNFSRNAGNN